MSKLLALLQDGRFHSGQALGEALGISRSSVWKQLQRIEKEFDLRIHKVQGRGYRLIDPFVPYDRERLASTLKDIGWTLHLHDVVDSTNSEALRLLGQGIEAPFVVLSERQTGGRGRRGRAWISPAGQNLYYSLGITIHNGPHQLAGMSLVIGLAVRDALHRLGVPDVGLKWPNDVYASGRKIAGILLELTGDPAGECHVVIGIGINCNMSAANSAIDQPWTSLRNELGKGIDRNQLLLVLSESLRGYLHRHEVEGFASLRLEWEANHIWHGLVASLSAGDREIVGEILGVDADGCLRLLVDGSERTFSGGELRLRLRDDS
ncbi:bifunctional biotin--[acetyl-CoA-carboxylase] ligase/biotin operon repressor BirA [Stutzerimonas azotifigens]|uniref:Bifunctional ligase/repressor BirA n=1 Tax=Stutzerimonas azotifigens TaxID=291995 RepID=A0ABR5Z6A1_9GAMM|nr:bifunctional biotin--[acetyl-CoA-carboxylase] ligase/biotin operon repressor BirA [Stutzerimonas azotifigens]MBA1275647.1 bifunctional biotin--[acetyl-CoA-carboxylase] ligase/biotin operon repressor BirA [Stutzerimonas azotifigens]